MGLLSRLFKYCVFFSLVISASLAEGAITGIKTQPGGPNESIQVNRNGTFMGYSDFTYSSTTKTMSVTNSTFTGTMTLSGGRIVSIILPTDGQILKWHEADGGYWLPSEDMTGGVGGTGTTILTKDGGTPVVNTSTLNFTGAQFVITDSGGESLITLDVSSVTLLGQDVLTTSSATATYLQNSSASITYQIAGSYLTTSSATATYLQNSSASITYAQLSGGFINNSQINGSSITKHGVLIAGSNITFTPASGSLTINSTGGGKEIYGSTGTIFGNYGINFATGTIGNLNISTISFSQGVHTGYIAPVWQTGLIIRPPADPVGGGENPSVTIDGYLEDNINLKLSANSSTGTITWTANKFVSSHTWEMGTISSVYCVSASTYRLVGFNNSSLDITSPHDFMEPQTNIMLRNVVSGYDGVGEPPDWENLNGSFYLVVSTLTDVQRQALSGSPRIAPNDYYIEMVPGNDSPSHNEGYIEIGSKKYPYSGGIYTQAGKLTVYRDTVSINVPLQFSDDSIQTTAYTGGTSGGDNLGTHIATKTVTAGFGISASTMILSGDIFVSTITTMYGEITKTDGLTHGDTVYFGFDSQAGAYGNNFFLKYHKDNSKLPSSFIIQATTGSKEDIFKYEPYHPYIVMTPKDTTQNGSLSIGINTPGVSNGIEFYADEIDFYDPSNFYGNVVVDTVHTATFQSTMTLSGSRVVKDIAPSDGQALVWDNANSWWEPGTISGGPGSGGDNLGTHVATKTITAGYGIDSTTITIGASELYESSLSNLVITNPAGTITLNSDMVFSNGLVSTIDRQYDLGQAAVRWLYVYASSGNFDGSVTSTKFIAPEIQVSTVIGAGSDFYIDTNGQTCFLKGVFDATNATLLSPIYFYYDNNFDIGQPTQNRPHDIYVGNSVIYPDSTVQTTAYTGVSGGASSLEVLDEGVQKSSPTSTINFVGAGVTATYVAPSSITVTIPGGGSGGPTIPSTYTWSLPYGVSISSTMYQDNNPVGNFNTSVMNGLGYSGAGVADSFYSIYQSTNWTTAPGAYIIGASSYTITDLSKYYLQGPHINMTPLNSSMPTGDLLLGVGSENFIEMDGSALNIHFPSTEFVHTGTFSEGISASTIVINGIDSDGYSSITAGGSHDGKLRLATSNDDNGFSVTVNPSSATITGDEDIYMEPDFVPTVIKNGQTAYNTGTGYWLGQTTDWTIQGKTYDTRKKLTVDGSTVTTTLYEYPVSVTLTTATFDFTHTTTNGYDLRFTLTDGTTLAFQRELHDKANTHAQYWVKIPTMTSDTDLDFYMYFKNDETITDAEDSTATWSGNGFRAVYHMTQKNGRYEDSSGYGNHVSTFDAKGGLTEQYDFSDLASSRGKYIKADTNTTSYWLVCDNASLNMGTTDYRIIMRSKGYSNHSGSEYHDGDMMRKGSTGITSNSWWKIEWGDDVTDHQINLLQRVGGTDKSVLYTLAPNDKWHTFVGERRTSDNTLRLYIDGSERGTAATSAGGNVSNDSSLGIGSKDTLTACTGPATDDAFAGAIDEVWISSGYLPSGFQGTTHANFNDSLLTYGSEESPNYVMSIGNPDANNVTWDGDALNVDGSLTLNGVAITAASVSSKTINVTISSGTTWDNLAIPIWEAPQNTAVTLRSVRAACVNGTSLTFNIEERAWASLASAGTDTLTSDLVADTNGAISTAFSNSGITTGAHLVFTTGASAASGAVDIVTFQINYTEDSP